MFSKRSPAMASTSTPVVERTKKIVFKKVKFQFLAAFCANFFVLGHGCSVGWVSPSLPILQSDASPIGPITLAEASWIGSLLSLGSGTGLLTFGIISVWLGNKRSILLCVCPAMTFWLIVIFAETAWLLCLGRFIAGLATGSFICIQLFVAEIADENVRGAISSLLTLNFNIGILFGYIGGTYLTYTQMPYAMMAFPIAFIFLFVLMPESPQSFLRKGNTASAEKSLRFYRNMKAQTNDDDMSLQKELAKLKAVADQKDTSEPLKLRDFYEPKARRALLIGFSLTAISQFGGTFVIVTYAKTIFTESGSNFDANTSAIILASLQIVGTICTSVLIERLGRKFLLILSCAGGAVGFAVMGAYSWAATSGHDVSDFNLVPVISLSFVILISSIGILPIPYIIIAELLPQKIRKVGGFICMSTMPFFAFILLRIFPYLQTYLELYGCMFLFASISTIGVFVSIFVVPETRGRNLNVLEQEPVEVDRTRY